MRLPSSFDRMRCGPSLEEKRFYRDRFLEELERATDGARKAYALADRVADHTHEISTLIVSREHMRQDMEGWHEEALRLREEVNKLKAEIEVQKGLADMYNEGFEEITSLLQN